MAKNRSLNYSEYLSLKTLLTSQSPISNIGGDPAHDEMLFIIVHQTYELWFKQILHELDSVIKIFNKKTIAESDISLVVSRLNRIIEIQKILIDQIRVLETMSAMDFLEFRDDLFPSSGFQSQQFRLLENKFGLRPEDRIRYGKTDYKNVLSQSDRDYVRKSENENSLFSLLEQWLERTPFLSFKGFDFWEKYSLAIRKMLQKEENTIKSNPNLNSKALDYQLKEHRKTLKSFEGLLNQSVHQSLVKEKKKRLSHKATKAALLIFLYREEPILHSPYNFLSKLIDIDELFTAWRQRHSLMVRRMIGSKIGTGGSSGHQYLKDTSSQHKIFTDIADLSTFIIPRSILPKLPGSIKRNLGYYFEI